MDKGGNSLMVQWLGLCTLTAKGWGSTTGQRTKILQGAWLSQKKKRWRTWRFSKDDIQMTKKKYQKILHITNH